MTVPVKIAPQEIVNIFIRAAGDNLQIPIYIRSQDNRVKSNVESSLWYGLYFGVVLSMLAFNFFIWAMLGQRVYLFYLFFTFNFLLFEACLQGFGFQMFWPSLSEFQQRSIGLCIASLVGSGVLFVLDFLEVRERQPQHLMVLRGLLACSGILVLACLALPQNAMLPLTVLLAAVTCPIVWLVGILSWRDGYTPAKYFVIAFAVFLGGTAVHAVQKFGMLAINSFTEYIQPVGNAAEVIPLSMALGHKLRQAQLEAIAAQTRTLQIERDLTQSLEAEIETRKGAESSLAVALEEAHRSVRAKNEFLANMSHELRTPLNALINIPKLLDVNFAKLFYWYCADCREKFVGEPPAINDLADDSLTCPACDSALSLEVHTDANLGMKESGGLLERLTQQGQYLDYVIGEVFIFSSLESESIKLRKRSVSVTEVIDRIVDEAQVLAASKGVHFACELTAAPMNILIDSDRIGKALYYLVHNAVVYTKSGGNVFLTVRDTVDAQGRLQLEFCLEDTGKGIPESAQARVFEAFEQAETGHTRSHGGVGLGLTIAQRLLMLHGSEIHLKSTVGEGSRFSFSLPVEEHHSDLNSASVVEQNYV